MNGEIESFFMDERLNWKKSEVHLSVRDQNRLFSSTNEQLEGITKWKNAIQVTNSSNT